VRKGLGIVIMGVVAGVYMCMFAVVYMYMYRGYIFDRVCKWRGVGMCDLSNYCKLI